MPHKVQKYQAEIKFFLSEFRVSTVRKNYRYTEIARILKGAYGSTKNVQIHRNKVWRTPHDLYGKSPPFKSDETMICCLVSHSDQKLSWAERDPICGFFEIFTVLYAWPEVPPRRPDLCAALLVPFPSSPLWPLSASPPSVPEALTPTLTRLCSPSSGRTARRLITRGLVMMGTALWASDSKLWARVARKWRRAEGDWK